MAKLIIEGQTHEVSDALVRNGAAVAEQDQNLRDALRPNFDLAADATFLRSEKDGVLTVTVVKSPGRKGSGQQGYTRIVRRLAAGKSELTPVMLLACEVQLLEARGQLQLAKLIVLRPRIERVLAGGRSDQQRMAAARRVLLEAPATAATTVPAGF